MLIPKAKQLKKFLEKNSSKKKHVIGRRIMKELEISDAEMRELFNYLRKKKFAIASDTKGYFYAKNSLQLKHTIAQLKSRVKKINEAIHGLENAVHFNNK